MRCEDWPACGHEMGCCPDFDENGVQLNMVCICGAKLPVNNHSSICNSCLRRGGDDGEGYVYDDVEPFDDLDEDADEGYEPNQEKDEEDLAIEVHPHLEDQHLDEFGHGESEV